MGQKKHSKTLSLKESNADYMMELKFRYLENMGIVTSPDKYVQSTKNCDSQKLEDGIEGTISSNLTPNEKEIRNPFSSKKKFSITEMGMKNNGQSVTSF